MGERTKLDQTQFDQYHLLLTHIAQDIRAQTKDSGKWQSILNDTISAGLAEVVKAIREKQTPPPPASNLLEVRFMFIVKNDNPPVPFSLVLGEVTDAEGNVISDAKLSTTVESDNTDAVAIDFDSATNSGTASFGNPGQANVVANVKSGETLLGTGAASFTVTLGDPAAISGVALEFEGLSEVEP